MAKKMLPQPPSSGQADRSKEQEKEREFIDAVARIYRRYGGDLAAFKRDVDDELAKRREPAPL